MAAALVWLLPVFSLLFGFSSMSALFLSFTATLVYVQYEEQVQQIVSSVTSEYATGLQELLTPAAQAHIDAMLLSVRPFYDELKGKVAWVGSTALDTAAARVKVCLTTPACARIGSILANASRDVKRIYEALRVIWSVAQGVAGVLTLLENFLSLVSNRDAAVAILTFVKILLVIQFCQMVLSVLRRIKRAGLSFCRIIKLIVTLPIRFLRWMGIL